MPSTVQPVLTCGNTFYIVLQMTIAGTSLYGKQCKTQGTYRMQVAQELYRHQPMEKSRLWLWNKSCVRCPTNMALGLWLPQESVLKVPFQSTVFHVVHIFFHSFANGYINTLQTRCFCTTINGPNSVVHMKTHTLHPQQSL